MDSFNFFLRAWLLGGMVFIPVFVIALALIRAPVRALMVSIAFTLGGSLAFATALLIGSRPGSALRSLPDTLLGDSLQLLYACAAAIGGGVLALFVFSKIVKTPPAQRF